MRRAFTLIELLVVISIIALLIAILLPALSSARDSARKMQSSTQVRGIHQGFVIFAQSNKTLFPGLTLFDGTLRNANMADIDTINYGGGAAGRHPNARVAIALEDGLFTPEYAISPAESNAAVRPWDANTVYNDVNDHVTSYGYSALPPNGNGLQTDGRAAEWQDTTNSRAIVMGDRATQVIVFGDPTTYNSLWGKREGNWNGSVLFNDNSVQFVTDREFEGTQYASHRNFTPDDLFINDPDPGVTGSGATSNCALRPGNGFVNQLPG